jgi:hypothetical protein
MKTTRTLGHTAAVLLATIAMMWPALYNRYPMLYPDSLTYIGDGHLVARAIFLHRLSEYYGMRSFIYSLGILPWHWNITLWPVVALQSLITAWLIWLVVRSIFKRNTVVHYLTLILVLTAFTSVGWFACLIMPDILAPALCLTIYLLIFAPDTLSRIETIAVLLIAWWAIVSHASHLILAVLMCFALISVLLLQQRSIRSSLKTIAPLAYIVLAAGITQLTLHAYLYGTPTLNGDRPPFLMGRIIADGPGKTYLQQHCVNLNWAICDSVQNLPDNEDDFFWSDTGIWHTADRTAQHRILQEEVPLVLATLRTYPRQQLTKSASNFWQQLTTYYLGAFDSSDYITADIGNVLPGASPTYLNTRQAKATLPTDAFSTIQQWTVIRSLLVIIALTTFTWRRSPRLAGLTIVIIFTVISNAFITGVLSGIDDRYQSRVIWLIPFLAGVFLIHWLQQRHTFLSQTKTTLAVTHKAEQRSTLVAG